MGLKSNKTVGGFPYILDYLHIYLPYSVVSLLSAFLGILGNSLVIASILTNKKLRVNATCILIANLAFSDLLISVFVHPSIVVGVFLGQSFFDQNTILCGFLGAICLVACGASLISMGFLAFNRYTAIFHYKKYREYFSVKNTLILSLISWTIGVLFDLPNFFDIGAHVYDLKVLSCHFDRLKVPYTVTFIVACIVVPCIIIGFLYMKIFCYALKISSSRNNRNRKQVRNQTNTLKAIKIAKSLFASFLLFFICWVPVAIVMLVGTEDQLPIWMHTFANLAAHFNSALNPLLYFIFNPKMREAYRHFFILVTLK